MRAIAPAIALVLLAVPLSVAASDHTDDSDDERMRIPVATTAFDSRATDAQCSAPGVDIRMISAEVVASVVVLQMAVADVLAAPRCAGRALNTAYTNYNLDLENSGWAISAIGGTTCPGLWSCIRVIKHGDGAFYEPVSGATGHLSGDTWVVRVPLSGTTLSGKPYDLRGQTYTLYSDAQQKHDPTPLMFFDTASVSSVQLR